MHRAMHAETHTTAVDLLSRHREDDGPPYDKPLHHQARRLPTGPSRYAPQASSSMSRQSSPCYHPYIASVVLSHWTNPTLWSTSARPSQPGPTGRTAMRSKKWNVT